MTDQELERVARETTKRLMQECPKDRDTGFNMDWIKAHSIVLSALKQVQPQTVILGFASWPDGSFELIVKDNKWNKETTLCGKLKDGQIEEVANILPTCVFINASATPQNVEPTNEQVQKNQAAFVYGYRPSREDERNLILEIRQTLQVVASEEEIDKAMGLPSPEPTP